VGVVRRRRLGLVAAIATVAFVCAIGVAWAREAGAWAIVRAPNYGRAAGPPAAPPLGVGRVVRAEVGPPVATLEAWVLDPVAPVRGTVLVLHGIRDQKASMLGVGRALAANGLRAVLVDLRGHGASSGEFLTYGVVESHDLVQLIDQLEALGIAEGPLGVYGASYGGAVAIQLASIDDRVRAVASLSTFSSLREVVPPYVRVSVPGLGELVPSALVDSVVDDAGVLAGFSPDAANTRRAIARTDAKVLLVHGDEDRHIPFEQARALSRACGDRCALVPIRGEDHLGAIGSDRAIGAAVDFLVANVPTAEVASIGRAR
jgi:pimeloyl-ACP methyl ester carboxylesterase